MADLFAIPSSIISFDIFPYFQSNDLLIFRLISTKCYSLVHKNENESEKIWKHALLRDFGFDNKEQDTSSAVVHYLNTLRVKKADPSRRLSIFGYSASEGVFTASSTFESWKHWRKSSLCFYGENDRCIHGPYFLRAAALWTKIERWCYETESGKIGKTVRSSLIGGIASIHWEFCAKNIDNDEGLLATQAIFAFYGGQNWPRRNKDPFRGLLGGYSAYDMHTCTMLALPHFRDITENPSSSNLVTIAGSYALTMKLFDLHVPTGKVYLTFGPHDRIPAVSNTSAASSQESNGAITQDCQFDSALIWLEEYTSRLQSGYYRAGDSPIPGCKAIHLFPNLTDLQHTNSGSTQITSRAVTRGVEVVASAVFTPEFKARGVCFIYSIRIRLLTPDDDDYVSPSQRGFQTCQLQTRHWRIHDCITGTTDNVRGEGVIGLYPFLREGGYRNDSGMSPARLDEEGANCTGYFQYQSCSGPCQGSFEGDMQFVPGSLQEPTGDVFDVKVAPFALDMKPPFFF